MNKNIFRLFVVLGIITTFSGCKFLDMFKGSKEEKPNVLGKESVQPSEMLPSSEGNSTDKPLVYLGKDKEPVLTETEFKRYLAQILKMYPQLGAMNIDNLPVAFKKTFLSKIIDQKLIIKEAKNKSYETSDKFQQDLSDAIKLLKEHMLIQEFEKRIISGIEVTDADVRSEYDKNKSKYIKTAGGVMVSGIQVDDEQKAEGLIVQSKGKDVKEFEKLTKSLGKFKEFGRVNQETKAPLLPNTVKMAALKLTQFPAVVTAKDGDKLWVVHVSDKQNTEYYAFNDIKGQVENYLKSQKFQVALGKRMETLRKGYPVEIVEELLDTQVEAKVAAPSKGVAIAG